MPKLKSSLILVPLFGITRSTTFCMQKKTKKKTERLETRLASELLPQGKNPRFTVSCVCVIDLQSRGTATVLQFRPTS